MENKSEIILKDRSMVIEVQIKKGQRGQSSQTAV